MRNRSLTRQLIAGGRAAAGCVVALLVLSRTADAGEDGTAVSTINHAFATELGTGVYDMGGRSIFVIRLVPEHQLRAPQDRRPGVRLVLPLAAGSFDFNPFDSLEADVPDRVDSFSLMPGVEFDFPRHNDWTLTPWLRVGGSFSEGQSDGFMYGAGARLAWVGERGGVELTRLHELSLVTIDYQAAIADDRFLRLRNALDLRQQLFRVSPSRHLMAGLYAIVDVVPDPPELPQEAGAQSVVQMELGITINTEPRPRIGSWRWPRLGFGYRMAGEFSGWRIVIGAPF
jgi:hypothetical protein